ncbi:MAG: methyltransferase [Pacificimonas sp.]
MASFIVPALAAALAVLMGGAGTALAMHHEKDLKTTSAEMGEGVLDRRDAAMLVDMADRPQADRDLDGSRRPVVALAFMNIEEGDRLLDVFSGGGYYSELLSHAVGENGSVVAHNPTGFALRDTIRSALGQRDYGGRLPNVVALNAEFDDMELAPDSLDGALFHLVYHDLYFESAELGLPRSEPQILLGKLHNALRPGGTVTVIDHVGVGDDPRAESEATHRINPDTVRRDFQQAGFVMVEDMSFFENPADDGMRSVFADGLRGDTDRFAMRFAKAADPARDPAGI